MKSKRRLLILCIVLLFISVICLCDAAIRMEAIMVEPQHINIFIPTEIPIQTIKPTQEPIKKQKETAKPKLSNGDKYLLAKIAMAEAEGESTKSKALVIATVLNRVSSKKFPSTIKEVIFQENQFSPTSNGRWEKVEPNKDCYKALNMVLKGKIKSKGSLYFESCSTTNNWHSRNLTYLFEIDAFRFYK